MASLKTNITQKKKKKKRRQAGFTAEPMFCHGVPYVFEGLRYFFINTRLICQFFLKFNVR